VRFFSKNFENGCWSCEVVCFFLELQLHSVTNLLTSHKINLNVLRREFVFILT